jgi:hypothetical protein
MEIEGSVLIMSKDTDYYVLFGDSSSVYISDFSGTIKHVETVWKCFLREAYSFDIIIRLAPLAGNDYCHESLIHLSTSSQNILELLNVDDSFKNLAKYKSRKIYKAFGKNDPPASLLTAEQLDEFVYSYNKEYFKEYFQSVMIYKNWKYFGKREKYQVAVPNIIEKFGEIYEWETEKAVIDWEGFCNSVKPVTDNDSSEIYEINEMF